MQSSLRGMRVDLVGAATRGYEAAHSVDRTARGRAHVQTESAAARHIKASRPSWWLLYTILPLTIVLFVVVGGVSPASGWRMVAECLSAVIGIAAITLWVHTNRMALILTNYGPQHPEDPIEQS